MLLPAFTNCVLRRLHRYIISGPAKDRRRSNEKYSGKRVAGLILLLTGLLAAVEDVAEAQRLPIKSYTTGDGLAHNGINRIVRDSRGFLWFCTDEGLSRFDGYSFTNYGVDQGLPHGTVTGFLETRSGELWLATYGGLVHFNPKGTPAGRVVYANEPATPAPMFTVVVPAEQDPLARAVRALLESRDGTIWCGTRRHLYRLERKGGGLELITVDMGVLAEHSKEVNVFDLLEDRHGSLWVASFEGLFRRWPDGSTAQYTRRDGLRDETIHDLLEDHQGRLWVGTRFGGFFRLAADESHSPPVVAEAYSTQNGFPTDWVFQLFETSDRRFWVATNVGLVEFFPEGDGQGRRFRTYTRRNGLSYHEISALNEDAGGNLWLGTNTDGAMKLSRNGFVTYGAQDGLVTVAAIFQDPTGGVCLRGAVLGDQRADAFDGVKMGSARADADTIFWRFGRFDGQRFDWFKPAAPFNFGFIGEQPAVQTQDGEWWVGSGEGLYRFPASDNFESVKTARPIAVYTMKDGLPFRQVGQVFADSRGNVWESGFGLARWDRASQTLHNLKSAAGLPPADNSARSFGEDRAGNIWISFYSGVARYRDGRFTFFTASDGLPPGPIMNIYPDRAGRLWLTSSRGGLIRVDDPAAERPSFASYTTAQGLSGSSTEAITEDLYGRIYVATGRGLDQLDPETGRIKHFTTDDGLAPGLIIAAFRDCEGALWLGTHRGLSRFMPAPEEDSPPPPILITGLNIGGERQGVSAIGEAEIQMPDLGPDRNQLQIDFVALGFAPSEGLRYQYRLEGSDDEWSPVTEQRTVNFAKLAPGRYRFLVRAVNAPGAASERPASISFRILRPVWQQWWFLMAVAVMAGLAAYSVYRYRVGRLLELERVRTRIAADLHDDIGMNLTRIAILSEVAHRRLSDENAAVEVPLSSIAQISRESAASMGDIVWAINPRHDHLIDLVQRMRKLANEVFASRRIELEFIAPEADGELRLGADLRRDVLLIFKEALNNVARHSNCSTAHIELGVENQWLNLRIADDGDGFDADGSTEGNGLANMKRRAQGLGGELRVTSVAGNGTELTLRVPQRVR
jgi:ligand-binding sensor domain-containing protein/signal transduction histidine kinase